MTRNQLKVYLNYPPEDIVEIETVARAMRYVESDGTPVASEEPFKLKHVDESNPNSGWKVTLGFHAFEVRQNENLFRRVWSVIKDYVQKAAYSSDGLTVKRTGTYPQTWDYPQHG
jgi:hypothetical protein